MFTIIIIIIIMSLNEIESKTGTSSSRQFENNAVKSAFERARRLGALNFTNEEFNTTRTTFNGKPIQPITVKSFRKALTPGTQPCATNFWKTKLNTELDSN